MSSFSKRAEKLSPSVPESGSHSPSGSTTPSGPAPDSGTDDNGRRKSRFRNSIRQVFSKGKTSTVKEPSFVLSQSALSGRAVSGNEILDPSPPNLLSDLAGGRIKKDEGNSEDKLAALSIAMDAVSLLQKITDVSSLVVPDYIGFLLDTVTRVLGTLKKMIENKLAWKNLLGTIDEHQTTFNEQLRRIKREDTVPDPESPLLAPMQQYADSLQRLTAEIINESGLVMENAPPSSSWEKVMRFAVGYLNADSGAQAIQEYTRRLSNAMDLFKLTLEIFTSFAVHDIRVDVAGISHEMRVAGEKLEEIGNEITLLSEPVDTIESRNITPFGGQHHRCLEGTRSAILEEIRTWARSKETQESLYCIADVAGTGKSTVAKTMEAEWLKEGTLAARFYFSQEGSAVRTASDFCCSIADQIEAFDDNPDLKAYWDSISRSRKVLSLEDVEVQWSNLVLEPLSRLRKLEATSFVSRLWSYSQNPPTKRYLLVIDALDECTRPTREPLLRCLLQALSSGRLPHVRILITTRIEPDLQCLLDLDDYHQVVLQKSLHDSVNPSGTTDIAIYVDHRLNEIKAFEFTQDDRSRLIERCGGLFLFAYLACELLKDSHAKNQPLQDILREFTSLDALYYRVLSRADTAPKYTREALRVILGIIVVAEVPLPLDAISALLPASLDPPDVGGVVATLGSILSGGRHGQPVYILHATFTEFLLRQNWVTTGKKSAKNHYAISKPQCNRMVAQGCLSILLKELKFDICCLDAPPGDSPPDFSSHHIILKRLAERSTAGLRYAASAWISHTITGLHDQRISEAMRELFNEKLLNWIELGAISKSLPYYMLNLRKLQSAMESMMKLTIQTVNQDDINWCVDAIEFLRASHGRLKYSISPLDVYYSALAFAPRQNQVYRRYQPSLRESLPHILLEYPDMGSTFLTLTGHSSAVKCVAYSSDGRLLASADNEGVRVWDTQTGAELAMAGLRSSYGVSLSLKFLPGDEIICLCSPPCIWYFRWENGGVTLLPKTLDVSKHPVCIAWDPGLTTIACGANMHDDNKVGYIHLFSRESGDAIGKPVAAHEDISSLSFSCNGEKLASTSMDWGLKIWATSPEGLSNPNTTWRHSRAIRSGVFSPIDPSFFFFLDGESVHRYSLTGHSTDWKCNIFNAWGMVIAPSGDQIATKGQGGKVVHLLRPPNTSSNEVWPARQLEITNNLIIGCMAFAPDGKHLATGGGENKLLIHTLEVTTRSTFRRGHRHSVCSMAFARDGQLLASLDSGGFLGIWDVEKGTMMKVLIQTGMQGHDVMALSGDGATIVSAAITDEIRFWNTEWRERIGGKFSLGYSPELRVLSMAFSPGDTRLAFALWDRTWVKIAIIQPQDVRNSPYTTVLTIKQDFAIPPHIEEYTSEIYPFPQKTHLQYHPSGEYICLGDHAWKLREDSPPYFIGHDADAVLRETFPPFIHFTPQTASLPYIYVASKICYIPQDRQFTTYATHDGLIALGADDGRVMVVNFTHLFTQDQKDLLRRIFGIRRGVVGG